MADYRQQKNRKKNLRKRKRLFAIEMVVLALLSLVLIACIWVVRKFSLLNHYEVDQDKLITAEENNAGSDDTGSADTGLSGVELVALVGLDTREGEEDQGENSDSMIICMLDHNNKQIKLVSLYRDTYVNDGQDLDGVEYYGKCNTAYAVGGPEQMLSMMNLNLDLNITEFATVRFKAVADTIDLLGGMDIDMTREELIHMNNYNVETSAQCGQEYAAVEVPSQDEFDGAQTRTFHLTGTQAVSYARIRYTAGGDMRRASRQRLVLEKMFAMAKQTDLGTLDRILDAVLPEVTTNLSNTKILSMVQPLLTYEITEQTGFPFAYLQDEGDRTGLNAVIPVTLEYNVTLLHQYLFPDEAYTPSATVQTYSAQISEDSGWDEDDIPEDSEDGTIPVWTEEAEAALQASRSSES